MVVSYTQEHVYRHPWHRVTAAAGRKFTDPAARAASGALAHILDVHTLSRDVDRRSGRLRAVRAIAGRTQPPPLLLRGLLAPAPSAGGGVVVLCVERTDVDAPARDMRVTSRNATLRGLVDVEERCSYAPHPERLDEWTLFRQETTIRCAGPGGRARGTPLRGEVHQECGQGEGGRGEDMRGPRGGAGRD